MNAVFADSGYRIAVASRGDGHHTRALEVSRALGEARIVTSEMVLTEVLGALSEPPVRSVIVQIVDSVRRDPNVEVVPQTGQLFREALDHYRSRPDKAWSLVDCASFLIMRHREIREALAHDRHFEQAGFVALLRD